MTAAVSLSESDRLEQAVLREETKIEDAILAILRLRQGVPGTLERFSAVQLRAIRRYCGRATGDLGEGIIG